MNDNVIEMPGVETDVENLKRRLADKIAEYTMFAEAVAQQRKIAYDAHIAAGFAPHEALILCANPGQ